MQGITLVVIACLSGATWHDSPEACSQEVVTNSNITPGLTWGGCLGISGQSSAREYCDDHPLFGRSERWDFGGYRCRIGPIQQPKSI